MRVPSPKCMEFSFKAYASIKSYTSPWAMKLRNGVSRNYNVKITGLIYQNTTDVIKEIDVAPPLVARKIYRLNYDAANYVCKSDEL